MQKNLDLTLTLTADGDACITYLEPESGDQYSQRFFFGGSMNSKDAKDAANQIGSEVLSWFSIMADELAEQEEKFR